jgi:hypothetical protein
MRKNLKIALNGITLQFAAEAIQDWSETSASRALCNLTYRRSLEDLACAVVLGEELCITSMFPKRHRDEVPPGEILARDLEKSLPVIELGKASSQSKDDKYWHDVSARKKIRSYLDYLESTERLSTNSPFWRDWIVREIDLYFGNHGSLSERKLPPESRIFSESHFIKDRELINCISAGFVRRLLPIAKSRPMAQNACEPALSEFIRQTALTHVVNYLSWAEAVVKQTGDETFQLPHVTRQTLIKERATKQDYRGMTVTFLMPRILNHAIKSAEDRSQLLDVLLGMRDQRRYKSLREQLNKAFLEPPVVKIGKKDKNNFAALEPSKAAKKLYADIIRLSSNSNIVEPEENYAVFDFEPTPTGLGIKVGGNLPLLAAKIYGAILPAKSLVRDLSKIYSKREYLLKLGDLFPEFQIGKS